MSMIVFVACGGLLLLSPSMIACIIVVSSTPNQRNVQSLETFKATGMEKFWSVI